MEKASPGRGWQAVLALGVVLALCAPALGHPLRTLHSFCSKRQCKDGQGPHGLAIDPSGNLYGVLIFDRESDGGAAYKLVDGKKFGSLHQFCRNEDCLDGARPSAAPIIDVNGNVYGTASSGGAHNAGVAYEISADGKYRKLYEFCSQTEDCGDGEFPSGGLTYFGAETGAPYDGASPLYGLTEGRVSQNSPTTGAVAYQLTRKRGSWTEDVLYTFCTQGGADCTDGNQPSSTLLPDSNGNLYGVTQQGGANQNSEFPNGAGVIFKLSRNGKVWTETVLYNFCDLADCADGAYPYYGTLVQDSSGTLYGTTVGGGHLCTVGGFNQTCGVVFNLSPKGDVWQESVLHAFCAESDCPDGATGVGPLAIDANGTLFGVTGLGGGNDIDQFHAGGGVLFQLSGKRYKVLHSFCTLAACADGEYPEGGVLLSKGVLYGTTYVPYGTVFKLIP